MTLCRNGCNLRWTPATGSSASLARAAWRPSTSPKTSSITAQHPHILPLFDNGSANGLFSYVKPYVEGETLRVVPNWVTQMEAGVNTANP